MNRVVLAFAVLMLSSAASPAAPQELTRCVAGQQVIDKEGKSGVIVADDSKLCQVKYADGQIYAWIFWNLHPTAAPAQSGLVTPDARVPDPTGTPPSANAPPALTVLRPSSNRSLVLPRRSARPFHADSHGRRRPNSLRRRYRREPCRPNSRRCSHRRDRTQRAELRSAHANRQW